MDQQKIVEWIILTEDLKRFILIKEVNLYDAIYDDKFKQIFAISSFE